MTPQSAENPQPKKLHIVAVSDTHGNNALILDPLKGIKGDIFIHAGDFTKRGSQSSFQSFFETLEKLDFRYKIVVAGNHEIMLDNGAMSQEKRQKCLEKYPCKLSRQQIIAQLKKRCIYLEHQSIEIEGVKIFGSPYTLNYCNTAFQYNVQSDQLIWAKVPAQVDILVTHCPPHGILDKSARGKNGGSRALKVVSQARKPRYHIFGHIHEGQGMTQLSGTIYVNVAKCLTRMLL